MVKRKLVIRLLPENMLSGRRAQSVRALQEEYNRHAAYVDAANQNRRELRNRGRACPHLNAKRVSAWAREERLSAY